MGGVPQTGTLPSPPQTLHWEVKVGPQEFGRHRNGFSRGERQKGHSVLAKKLAEKRISCLRKRLGVWKIPFQKCESSSAKTPKP